jgi:hypothetical protein
MSEYRNLTNFTVVYKQLNNYNITTSSSNYELRLLTRAADYYSAETAVRVQN